MTFPAFGRILAALALATSLAPPPASAKDSIAWMEASMPPYFIQEGVNKEQGYGDIITEIIQQGLPDYDHEEVVTNITRHFYKFKQGEKVCSVGLYRTPERQEFMHFSIPSFITLPPVIIVRKETLQKFDPRAVVKLDEILARKQLMIGVSKDRSFGISTDAILKKHKDSGSILELPGPELSLNLFKMLTKGRIDGLVGLPEEALYQAEQLGIREQLATLTIEENQQNYDGWFSAVGCSKNAWGQQVIDRVNKVLIEQRPTERYRAAYERWLDPNSIEIYRTVYQQVFLNATR